jgi:ATP-binding cassette subfamily B protein
MTNYVTATVPGVLNSITTAVVFIVGGYMTINGQLTVGSLIAFSAYMVRATGPIQTLLGLYVAFQRAVVSLERLNDIRGEHAEVSDSADAIALNGDTTPDIVFDNVSFSYTQDHPVLRNVSFTLPAACKVLVRGPSGVGKTTLVDLLHRHYDPSEGKIRLGNIDLRHYQLQSLRRRIAVIAQDTALLSGSILDNIVYANPDATEADMSDVLVRAQLADYIADLPDGMNTQVGVRGTALSGGQRQRIAIARALLQSPLVIILDEATTGVDPTTERKIIDAVDDIFVNRTRLIIGHRPQLNEHYDLVLTLTDDGKMSLSGPA